MTIIRKLQIDDYDKGYLQLLCQLFQLNEKDIERSCNKDYFMNKYKLMLNQGTIVFIIEDNLQKIIGNIKVLIESNFFYNIAKIDDLVIDKNYRNKKFGKQLIKYTINYIKNNYNCYKIILNCEPHLESFYTKLDFEKDGNKMVLIL